MAEHTHSGAAELGAPMDYQEHERTYAGFLTLTKLTVLASAATLVSLALYAFGGAAGFWWGTLLLVLMAIAFVIGLVAKGTAKPLIFVTVFGFLLLALTAG
jgi:fatty acid desaturase